MKGDNKKQDEETNKSIGKAKVGAGTQQEKEMEIMDFVQAIFKDDRKVSIAKLEDGSMIISVDNPVSSGRCPSSDICLSEESVMAVMNTVLIYFLSKGRNIKELVRNSLSSGDIEIKYSYNINPPFSENIESNDSSNF